MDENMRGYLFPGNLALSKGKGWFVPVHKWKILLCWDYDSGQCQLIAEFPDMFNEDANWWVPQTIVNNEKVFIFSQRGNTYWMYDCESKILVEKKVRYSVVDPVRIRGDIFLTCIDSNILVRIDGLSGEVIEYIELGLKEEKIGLKVCIQDKIYVLNTENSKMYTYNCGNGVVTEETLGGLPKIISTLGYDGDKCWLSGCKKALYTWNPRTGNTNMLDIERVGMGRYDYVTGMDRTFEGQDCEQSLFRNCLYMSGKVWFVPYAADKMIYVDEREIVRTFDIIENEEVAELRNLWCRFLLLYNKDERYIGLYSGKTNRLLEVDTVTLTWRYKDIVDTSIISRIVRAHKEQFSVAFESRLQKYFYYCMLEDEERNVYDAENIGHAIYHALKID